MISLLLFLSPPAIAAGDYEMFEEVCSVTGELRVVERWTSSAEVPGYIEQNDPERAEN